MSLLSRIQLAQDSSVTVANLVDEILVRRGNSVITVSDNGTYTLAELHAEVCEMDAWLRTTLNIQPGQTVAIYRSNNRRCFHWLLAVIRAGGIAVPLNPQLSLTEIEHILSTSGTDILIIDAAVYEKNLAHRHIHSASALKLRHFIQDDPSPEVATIPGLTRFLAPPPEAFFPPTVIDPRATIAIFHTSGTSGFPKGAALSSRALLAARATTVITGIFLSPRDLAFVALPWSHIMAVSIALYGLVGGIRGCFLDRFDLDAALSLVERHRITAFVGVPEIFTRLVNASPDPSRLRTVRLWISASDYLPIEVRTRLRRYGALLKLPFRRVPPVLINGYGMVELGGLAMMGVELSILPGASDFCFTVPPYRIRIANEQNKSVRIGQTGELQIQRPGFKPQYWRTTPSDSTAGDDLLTTDGWLRTGDLARRNWLGLIQLVGRIKDVIKSGGYSVYVRELEEALLAHASVARAVAFGLPHAEKGEVPVAAVELHADQSASGESDLTLWCRSRLAAYKSPRRIWIVPPGSLPQNANGKMLRRELREKFAAEMQEPSLT
jgi:long-chain acyl-CoA synthetase